MRMSVWWLSSVYVAAAISATACENVCNSQKGPIVNDEYSRALVYDRSSDLARTVSRIVIYREDNVHWDRREPCFLAEKQPVRQITDAALVARFLSDVHENVADRTCNGPQADYMYHVLAFDDVDSRVGYFILRQCRHESERDIVAVGTFQTDGGLAVSYSTAMTQWLKGQ
jgi:hypothetical protein